MSAGTLPLFEASAKAKVMAALSLREGRQNGITARELARLCDTTERDVRKCVSELRAEGVAVCGHPRNGYFIAACDEDLNETCEFLYGRAMHSLALISKLKRVALPDLRGQLKLKT